MPRRILIFILLIFPISIFAAQSRGTLLYTLLPGETIDTSFQYYFNANNNIYPCLKVNGGKDIYIIYRGKKHGPFKRISKSLFDPHRLLILVEMIDHQNKSHVLTYDNKVFGKYTYVMDWKYNAFNHLYMAHFSYGRNIVMINGEEYGPYDVVNDLKMNKTGTKWSFIAQNESTEFYVTDQWNQFVRKVKVDLDLYKPQKTSYFQHYHDEDWKQWAVVYESDKKMFIGTSDKKNYGPFDQIGNIDFYGFGQWIVPVRKEGKYLLLDSGTEKPLDQKILDQQSVYSLPGNDTYPYLVITEKWKKMSIVSQNKVFGPYNDVGIDPNSRISISGDQWLTTIKKGKNQSLLINGLKKGDFDNISDIHWNSSGNNWLAIVSPHDDPWNYLYISGVLHQTAFKELLAVDFVSLQNYIFAYIGRDEKIYVESSDSRRWGPFQDVYQVWLSGDEPYFSVREKNMMKVYQNGFPINGISYSLQKDLSRSPKKGDMHWITVQDNNIIYQ